MEREEVIRMARGSGLFDDHAHMYESEITRFAALVAAHERYALVDLAKAQGWAMKNEDPFEDALRDICAMRDRAIRALP